MILNYRLYNGYLEQIGEICKEFIIKQLFQYDKN